MGSPAVGPRGEKTFPVMVVVQDWAKAWVPGTQSVSASRAWSARDGFGETDFRNKEADIITR
jgi:hypothetical protein